MSQPKIKRQRRMEMLRVPSVKDVGISLVLLFVGRASVLGMLPFGVAFFASCFDKSIAYLGITVLAIATMTSVGNALLTKYIIASLLYWIYTRFTDRESVLLDSVVVGASVLIGGLAFLIYGYVGFYDVLMLFVESMVASIMFVVFKKSKDLLVNRRKRKQVAQDELISVALSLGVVITGFSGINFPYGISIADIASVYAVLCIALYGGISAAGSGGLCIGFMSAMSSSSSIISMGIFGMSALMGNLLKSLGRVGVALGFLGGSAVALLYSGNSTTLPVSIVETAVGAVLFVITPGKLQNGIKSFFGTSLSLETIGTDVRVKEYLSMRLEKIASALRSLEQSFKDASQKRLKTYKKDVSTLLDEVSHRVCENCPNAVKCWQKDFTKTYRSIMALLHTIEEKGILEYSNLPSSLLESCIKDDLMVLEFCHVYELYKKGLIHTNKSVTGRNLVAMQYEEMAQMMEEMSDSIYSGFCFREDMEEMLVAELDKEGISSYEISVVENSGGKNEVYLGVSNGVDIGKIEGILENTLEVPMAYENESINGLMKFTSRAKFTADVAIKQICRDYSEASGDSIDNFITEDYKQYIILSDGMGSGKRAMNESRITLKLLKEFLQSGFGIKSSVAMVNSSFCLKLDYECFATVDLLCIDLMSGVCEFYKIGAAESIIRHGDNVETVFAPSLPIGMPDGITLYGQTKRLGDGDVVLMLSDGISEAGFGTVRTDWLKNEITLSYKTMEELAENVLKNAVKKSHDAVIDDMTVAAVRITSI